MTHNNYKLIYLNIQIHFILLLYKCISFIIQVYTSSLLLYKRILHEKSSVNLSEEDILSVSSFSVLF